MSLTGKHVSQITESDLLALIADGEAEGKTIDYKRDRVGQTDGDKKEFLYDVSSFANAAGGHLVFGMDEQQGVPITLVGISGIDPDAEIVRLEQIARDGLRPPINGIESAAIPLANGAHAIVLHIPKSWNPPHQVTYQKAFRFYGRDTNAKYQIDVDELRSIFSRSEGIAERIRLFRIDRVAKVVANEGPVALEPGAKVLTHIVPLSAFASTSGPDITPLYRDHTPLITMGHGGSVTHNLDGLLLSNRSSPASYYTQLFRNGCIEVVDSYSEEANKRQSLPSVALERAIVSQVRGAKKAMAAIGAQPPVVMFVTLLGMKGWYMGVDPSFGGHGGTFDRNPVLVPETILETFDGNDAKAAKPLIDMIWNGAGWPGSPYYDAQGMWTAGR